jgi:hypothetical protein
VIGNRAPVLNSIGNKSVAEGGNVSFTLAATDPDGDSLTFSPSTLPANASLNSATGAFTFSPNFTQAGSYSITFSVSDGQLSDSETMTITVTNTNRAPTANAGADRTVTPGSAVTLNGSGSNDPDGDPLSYAWTQTAGPAVTLNGAATASPTFTPAATGAYVFELSVNDGNVASAPDTVTINVSSAPTAGLPFVEDFESGSLGSYWAATGAANFRTQVTSANGPRGTRHATMDSSASNVYSRNELTLTIDLEGKQGIVLSFWAKEFGDEAHAPPSNPFSGGANFDGVAVSTDGTNWYEVHSLRSLTSSYAQQTVDLDAAIAARGLAYTKTFKIRFNQYDNYSITTDGIAIDDIRITGNQAPVLSAIGNQTVSVGQTLALTLSASDGEGDSLTFSAGSLPAGATLDSTSGAFAFTPTSSQVGTYSITFSVSDGRGGSDSETITISVVSGQDPLAYTGLSTGGTMTQNWIMGTQFRTSQRIRVTEIMVDGRLNGSSNNIGLYKEGNYTPLATFSVATGTTPQVLSVSADVVLDAGTYRLAGAFREYRTTELGFLSAAPEITVLGGVYRSGTSLYYPSTKNTLRIYGHVNFRYRVEAPPAPPLANQPPTLDPIPSQTTLAGTAMSFVLKASDPDGDPITFYARNLPVGAQLDSPTGAFTFTPPAGTHAIDFVADDGRGGTAVQKATITAVPK